MVVCTVCIPKGVNVEVIKSDVSVYVFPESYILSVFDK